MSSLGKMYRLLNVCLIKEHQYSVFLSGIFRLGSLYIDPFYFINLLIHILIFFKQ